MFECVMEDGHLYENKEIYPIFEFYFLFGTR